MKIRGLYEGYECPGGEIVTDFFYVDTEGTEVGDLLMLGIGNNEPRLVDPNRELPSHWEA